MLSGYILTVLSSQFCNPDSLINELRHSYNSKETILIFFKTINTTKKKTLCGFLLERYYFIRLNEGRKYKEDIHNKCFIKYFN